MPYIKIPNQIIKKKLFIALNKLFNCINQKSF